MSDIDIFRRLLTALWKEQNVAWTIRNAPNRPSERGRTVNQRLLSHPRFCNQLAEKALESRLPTPEKLASDFGRTYLRLPPIRRASNFVSLFWLGYNFATTPQEVRIRITMFCIDGTNLEHFPFRLEYESGGGTHDFHHAQLGNADGPPNPLWLPCQQPSFPLAAKCPVTLVLATLLSLYGLKETGQLLNKYSVPLGAFTKELEPWVVLK